MATKWGRLVPFFFLFFFLRIFNGVFVRFLTKGVQKHYKNVLGEIHVKNFWPKKLRKKPRFSCRFFPSICFYRVVGCFSA
jgi:hypothetical protein